MHIFYFQKFKNKVLLILFTLFDKCNPDFRNYIPKQINPSNKKQKLRLYSACVCFLQITVAEGQFMSGKV